MTSIRSLAALLSMMTLVLCCAESIPTSGGMPSDATAAEIAEARRLMALSLDTWVDETVRLQRITQKMRVAGGELCGSDLGPVLGAAVIDVDAITPELRPLALETLGPHGKLHIVAVFDGMAADRAGILPGDSIVSVQGRIVRRMPRLIRSVRAGVGSIDLSIERNGRRIEVSLPVELGCKFVTTLVRAYRSADMVNAQLDRSTVMIHLALAREISDDDKLAAVIGHEMVHGILWRDVGRRLGPKIEQRADHLGCYLAARAGYRLDPDARLFQVLLRDLNRLDEEGRTHPATHERILALRKTLEEIERKRAANAPLVPGS
ncbi:MAG: hypothetical protein ACE5FL_12665 [Myxococcota bacterium]